MPFTATKMILQVHCDNICWFGQRDFMVETFQDRINNLEIAIEKLSDLIDKLT